MPLYKCHKVVGALKIDKIVPKTDGGVMLHFVATTYAPIRMDRDWVEKHDPQAGGYFVVYKDGYKSFSPAKAFESGYTLIAPVGTAA